MTSQSRDEPCRLGVDECDVLTNYQPIAEAASRQRKRAEVADDLAAVAPLEEGLAIVREGVALDIKKRRVGT
jgi:hypothetical protein